MTFRRQPGPTVSFPTCASPALLRVPRRDYTMSGVRRAHEDLRARRTTGKLVVDPGK